MMRMGTVTAAGAALVLSDFFFNPSPGFFPTVDVFEDEVVASGGVMTDGSFAGYFVFHIDVPDGITEFTLRQTPIAVPEPSTALLVAMGLLATGGIRRPARNQLER